MGVKKSQACRAWWPVPVTPGFGKWRLKDKEGVQGGPWLHSQFEASMKCIKQRKPAKHSTPPHNQIQNTPKTEKKKKALRLATTFNIKPKPIQRLYSALIKNYSNIYSYYLCVQIHMCMYE